MSTTATANAAVDLVERVKATADDDSSTEEFEDEEAKTHHHGEDDNTDDDGEESETTESDTDDPNEDHLSHEDYDFEAYMGRHHDRRMAQYHAFESKYGFRVVAYVNSKAGGQSGAAVLRKLRKYMPYNHVHDLLKEREGVEYTLPQHIIEAEEFSPPLTVRILACGGDGTIGWVASSVCSLNLAKPPAIAPIPLGTGNDLAKKLNWGKYFRSFRTFRVKTLLKRAFKVRLFV